MVMMQRSLARRRISISKGSPFEERRPTMMERPSTFILVMMVALFAGTAACRLLG
jgi:hypothetical protein